MRYLLFLLPIFSFGQDVVNDTVYIKKQGDLYYIITQTEYSDSTITGNKELLGDSTQAITTLLRKAEGQSTTLSLYAKPLILKGKAVKRINYYNNLHLQISGKPVYSSTALRDTTAFLGDWTLVFNGENILGEIQINNANRFIFNPDNGKVYSISTNLLLSTFTNQVSFAFNGVRYDLYKFANGKFATVDNEVRLIKKE
jgi:hypothetical protein